ncbi:MAG: type VI secretion system baseplate subunit TssE [Proteobacteria bacterium]|nr:type VI secretion system baseplate subunit TssE [Pseudomonadota bacterium]
MNERTLLERIRNPRPDEALRTSVDYSALVDSVLDNLRHMLNTRQGGVPVQPDYGIPEFGNVVYSMPEGLGEFQQAIKATIEKYEPRLRHVRVKFQENEDDLQYICFEITARLAVEEEDAVLRFRTLVDSSGQVNVKD